MKKLYENSKSYGSAEIVYLAYKNEMLVCNGDASEYGYYHAKDKNLSELWIAADDENNNTVLTMLISYKDQVELFEGDDWEEKWRDNWDKSIIGQITNLSNRGIEDEESKNHYWSEIFDIMDDAFGKLEIKTLKKFYKDTGSLAYYSRTCDFAMHEPTPDYIHTGYCT